MAWRVEILLLDALAKALMHAHRVRQENMARKFMHGKMKLAYCALLADIMIRRALLPSRVVFVVKKALIPLWDL